jgi:hypothetical protein
MKRHAILALSTAASLHTATLARDSLGVFNDWGAFRDPASDSAPLRCYAIAQPQSGWATLRYATIAFWPASRVRAQFHVRLASALPPRSAIMLRVGSQRFALVMRGTGAWAANAQMDAAIVAALRSNQTMSINAGGVTATWVLRGVATAIDASALGCARD